MSWVSAPDVYVMSANQQIRIHFADSCVVSPSYPDISSFIAAAGGTSGGGSIASVASVTGDSTATFSNLLSVLTNYYIAIINPVDGASVGQLRSDMLNAIQALNQTSGFQCSNFTVGLIEYDDGKGILSGLGVPTSLGIPVSLIAVAVIAVVVLILLKK